MIVKESVPVILPNLPVNFANVNDVQMTAMEMEIVDVMGNATVKLDFSATIAPRNIALAIALMRERATIKVSQKPGLCCWPFIFQKFSWKVFMLCRVWKGRLFL